MNNHQIETEQKRHQLLRALLHLEEMLAKHGSNARLRIALGEAEFRLAILPDTGVTDAIKHLRRAVTYDPFHPKLFFHLARCLHKVADYQGAIHTYQQAIQLAPGSQRSYLHLALSLLELGEYEKNIGRDFIYAVVEGREADLQGIMEDLDALLEAQRTAASDKKFQPPARKFKSKKLVQGSEGNKEWNAALQIALICELLTENPKTSQIDTFLKAAQGADLATITVLQLLNGLPVQKAEERLKDQRFEDRAATPARQLLNDALACKKAQDEEAFTEQTAKALEEQRLPIEIICSLYYDRYQGQRGKPIKEVLACLDLADKDIQAHPLFRELRIAVLDSYARQYWLDERYPHAQLIWGEVAALDSYNIAVEHNLALLSVRLRSEELYTAAWTRATELRYLYAAATEDIQVLIEDRKTLHLAVTQQSYQRHINDAQKGINAEEMAAWLKDQAAVEAWLYHWNLYYLNARLAFQSPVHLLGIPYDASEHLVINARNSLLSMIENTLETTSWTGVKTFCNLAREKVEAAAVAAQDVVLRARDPYCESEKKYAFPLLQEALKRMSTLQNMINYLHKAPPEIAMKVKYTLGKHLFMLPLDLLELSLKAEGHLEQDASLIEIFLSNFLGLVMQGNLEVATPDQLASRIAALEECIVLMPDKMILKTLRLQLLSKANRSDETYQEALKLLAELPKLPPDATPEAQEEYQQQREGLQNAIDSAAMTTLPNHLLKPKTPQEAEQLIKAGKKALQRFPKAHGLRQFIAHVMQQIGQSHEASTLLNAGIALTDDPELTEGFREQARQAASVGEIEQLLKDASQSVNAAYEAFEQDSTPEHLITLKQAVTSGITLAGRAIRLAEAANMAEYEAQAHKLLDQFRQLQGQFEQREQNDAAAKEIVDLLNRAVQQFHTAQEEFDREKTRAALDIFSTAVSHSLQDVQKARQLAQKQKIKPYVEQSDTLIRQFQQVQKQIDEAKRR